MYFSTPRGKWSTRVYDLCMEWVKRDCEVHVITAKYYKSDLINFEGGTHQINKINVHIIDVEIKNNHSLVKRLFSFWTFSTIAIIKDYKLGKGTRIYSSGPVSVLFQGLLVRSLFRKQINCEIRDLWPEGIEELGVIKNKTLLKLIKLAVKMVYSKSNQIFVLSSGMKDYIVRNYKIHHSKIHVAPNFITQETEILYDNLNYPEKMLLYFGNFGEVNKVFDLVNLFYRNQEHFNANLVIIGDGPLKNKLIEFSKKSDRIFIYPPIPRHLIPGIITNSLAAFVPLKKGEIMDTSSPNKFFETIGQGTPVIQSTNGWIKEIVAKNELGFSFNFEDDLHFRKIIKELEKESFNRPKIKKYALKNFNKENVAKGILERLKE